MAGKGSLGRVPTDRHKEKTSESLKQYYVDHPEVKEKLASTFKDTKKRHVELFREASSKSGKKNIIYLHKVPTSLMELSKRTVCKILKRLGIGCSRCGWNEAAGDLHHIHGRKIQDANHHCNLTYLCPNCHRLAHSNKIQPGSLISLEVQVGDRWKEYYFPERAGIKS